MENAGCLALALLAVLGTSAYCVPMILAGLRNHHQAGAIFALNLFLGWTGIGWVAALVWALSATKGGG